MKLKDGLMLREIAGQWVVVPMGEMVIQFSGIITLNETGAFLWKQLEQGCDEAALARLLCQEYMVDEETAISDVREFLDSVWEKELLIG